MSYIFKQVIYSSLHGDPFVVEIRTFFNVKYIEDNFSEV